MLIAATHVELLTLCLTAAGVGLVHTLLGPDHYLPFIAMARVGGWSRRKTLAVTILCGIGHVGSSVVLGVFGIALGVAVFRLENIEAVRGDLAAWLLLGFGLAYTAWGLRRAYRNRPHTHLHVHADGTVHAHQHDHRGEHVHVHDQTEDAPAARLTPWVLFTIFVFGPCEPLIPLLMYPAAGHSLLGVGLVTLVFGLATIATMTAIVVAALAGAARLSGGRLERYGHAAAGLMLTACGAAVLAGL